MTEPSPLYLSQSECADWLLCPFKAHSRYVAGYRPGREETMPQRVGSIGHAILAEWARARFVGRPPSIVAAVQEEMEKRGWDGVSEEEFDAAEVAAVAVAEHPDVHLSTVHLAPDLWGERPGPLADVVVLVDWRALLDHMIAAGLAFSAYEHIKACSAVRRRFAGIEGHPDLVGWPDGPGGPLVVYDWKFRQHIDLGGADGEVVSEVPDRQFAWYGTLLRAAGLAPAGGIELWQVNAYAGRWATVEDFIRVSQGGARSEAEAALVTQHGLPTRDRKRMDDAGVAVTADVWAEAHRHLANVRHADRMDHWRASMRTLAEATAADGRSRRPPPKPDLLSYAERDGFDRFMADLRAQQPVIVRKMRSDPVVCLEVVRDMIVGVEGPLRLLAAGLAPARHLQSWPRSACMRPFGCAVQPICLPTLGTFRGAEESVRRATVKRLPVYDEAGNLSAEAAQ